MPGECGEADADEVAESLICAGEPFISFPQPLPTHSGTRRPLHHPAFGQDLEAWRMAQFCQELGCFSGCQRWYTIADSAVGMACKIVRASPLGIAWHL